MNITFVRAIATHALVYINIGEKVISRFNCVPTTIEGFLKEIEESIVYMIYLDDRAVGFISYVLRPDGTVYISEVQIVPVFQGNGIGGTALSFVLNELIHVREFDLYTHPESRAQRLYARFGFERVGGISENHRGTGEPRIRMVLNR